MELDDEEYCITGLSLGLGITPTMKKRKVKTQPLSNSLDLSIDLCPEHHDDADDEDDDEEEEEEHRRYLNAKSGGDNNNKNGGGCRKKLRLTKEQSAMLESTFKLHTTLNSAQKQTLADQLNLKTRQIEVWFQNRRARTKLKQTEVDCEFLKKRCQSLTDENRRLKKELQELHSSLKVGTSPSPLYIQLPKAATLTMCSSCEKLVKPNDE